MLVRSARISRFHLSRHLDGVALYLETGTLRRGSLEISAFPVGLDTDGLLPGTTISSA